MNMQVDKLFVKMHTWVTFEKVFYAAELSLGFYMFKKPSKSEVIGRCGGNEKTEWSRRTDKSWTLIFFLNPQQSAMSQKLYMQHYLYHTLLVVPL